MKPAISLLTLGVADLERATAFFRDGLGWGDRVKPQEGVTFIQLNNIVLSLFPRTELAKDAQVPETGSGFSGITLAHNVGSEAEVDACLKLAETAGATILKPGQKVFWGGYSGYFKDLDGHLWEVAHNPFWKMNEDGTVALS